MVRVLAIVGILVGCHGGTGTHATPPDAPPDATPDAPIDHWKQIFDEVDASHLISLVQDTAHERYSDAGRQQFLAYWTQYMTNLGLTVNTIDVPPGPRAGTDLEAVLPGPSADSFVVIVHYDSIGPMGAETMNPGADDDMSGMAIELETARILVEHEAELAYTVRFVASDEEELGGLAGARAYAAHVQATGLHVIAAVDDEQSGWNCHASQQCLDDMWPAFDVFTCNTTMPPKYDYPMLLDQMTSIVTAYSPLQVHPACMGANSDHYAMWEIGVPALVFGEHSPFANPHFDQEGGDTVDLIDPAYLAEIARPAITFQAVLAGVPR